MKEIGTCSTVIGGNGLPKHTMTGCGPVKFFWSDIHFDHEKVITKMGREAESIEKWNEIAVDALNQHVGRNDILYILGDFAWNRPVYWRQQINCRHVVLITGNHDPNKTKRIFREVYDIKTVKVHGVYTVLCHYPMAFWDKSHQGSYHLYGHIHHCYVRENMLDRLGDRRSMDVSPEASLEYFGHFRPFNEDDVHQILGSRKGHDFADM